MDFEGLLIGFLAGLLLPYILPAIVKILKGNKDEGVKKNEI